MTLTTRGLALAGALVLLGGSGLLVPAILQRGDPYSFLGISGSPAARILSRFIIDHADSAFHGGATHDVRFVPETQIGRVMLDVIKGRGEEGAAGRRLGGEGGLAAYSQNVGKWVQLSRYLDPGNFDALLTDCHYTTEGVFDVEVDSPRTGEEARGQVGEGDRDARETRRKVAKKIRDFFNRAKLVDKTSLYNAAIAVQMLNEAEPWAFGIRKPYRSRRVGALVDLFIKNGDRCHVVWGSAEDAAAARKFAVAVSENIKHSGGEKIPFTNDETSRTLWHE